MNDKAIVTIYEPAGFLTWNDERHRAEHTPRLEDAATFTPKQARGMLAHSAVNGCAIHVNGTLMTLAELEALCK